MVDILLIDFVGCDVMVPSPRDSPGRPTILDWCRYVVNRVHIRRDVHSKATLSGGFGDR